MCHWFRHISLYRCNFVFDTINILSLPVTRGRIIFHSFIVLPAKPATSAPRLKPITWMFFIGTPDLTRNRKNLATYLATFGPFRTALLYLFLENRKLLLFYCIGTKQIYHKLHIGNTVHTKQFINIFTMAEQSMATNPPI